MSGPGPMNTSNPAWWRPSVQNQWIDDLKAIAVSRLCATGMHPVRARRLVRDTATVTAAEAGDPYVFAVDRALLRLVREHEP